MPYKGELKILKIGEKDLDVKSISEFELTPVYGITKCEDDISNLKNISRRIEMVEVNNEIFGNHDDYFDMSITTKRDKKIIITKMEIVDAKANGEITWEIHGEINCPLDDIYDYRDVLYLFEQHLMDIETIEQKVTFIFLR